ncbi:MAG: squalene cyclase [Pseudonocardiales bacterium]
MTENSTLTVRATVRDWLLDSDPALRWQALRDLGDAPAEAVAEERARVATEGWGARLLALRGDDGQWAGGACFPTDFRGDFSQGQPWTATFPTLTLLRDLGVDPNAAPVREAIALVSENCRWEHDGQPFFAGEVEPCINGRTVAIGAYFGADVDGIVDRLLGEQLEDGGWNCETENGSVRSSFNTTICVLDGLLEHERATGASAQTAAARRRGQEYLLERSLLRRLSTEEVVDPDFGQFSFPTWWHYDVLFALDYFRAVGHAPDPRLADAVELVRSKRQPDGTWLLENTHPGAVHFSMEDGDGQPSRWNTLHALRVLSWYDRNAR